MPKHTAPEERKLIGDRIAELRRMKGWLATDLADKIGANKTQISQWENGDRFPPVKKLRNLATVFGISMEDLLKPQKGLVPATWITPAVIQPPPAPESNAVLKAEYTIPLLGRIAATPFRLAEMAAATKYVAAQRADVGNFALEIDGNSMSPKYLNNDIIYVKPVTIELTPFQPGDDDGMAFVPYEHVSHLNGQDCVVLHNGDSSFKHLEVTRSKGRSYSVDIISLNEDKKSFPTIHVHHGHEFFVQGICYKFERRYSNA